MEEEKKNEKKVITTHGPGYSNLVTHPSTNSVKQGLTFLSKLNMLLSLWCSDYINAFLFFF